VLVAKRGKVVEPELATVVGAIGLVTSITALLLGYLSEKSAVGAIMLGGMTAVASGLCFVGTLLGGWIGLLLAILLVTFQAHRTGKSFGKQRGAISVPALWLGFCGSCAIGYWAGRWWGLLLITLPSLVLFWSTLGLLSQYLLPLKDNSQWIKAFRSLISFSLGTSHPYYALEDREIVERVSGTPFGLLLAGPGIILGGPAHAPIIWDGVKFKAIAEPGLAFTGKREMVYQTADLRPQLRSFPVEAITKDGIRVRVLTFFPFKLHAGGKGPALKKSFPYSEESVNKALRQQPVEQGEKHPWDELARIVATRILRRILGEYRFDELCAPTFDEEGRLLDHRQDPRLRIKARLVEEVRQELEPCGIEVIGGGIGNLMPVDGDVIQERTEAWRVEWRRKIEPTRSWHWNVLTSGLRRISSKRSRRWSQATPESIPRR
jgi:hypothetical protein